MANGLPVDELLRTMPPEVWNHDLIHAVVLRLREPLAGTPVQVLEDGPHLKSSILLKVTF
jgi:hypothetical protein